VLFARITTSLLAPILGVSLELFPSLNLQTLLIKDIWISFLVGVLLGLFAVGFLNFYKLISKFFNTKLKKINPKYKIFGVFALTFALGLCSFSFISTGHELIHIITHQNVAFYMLILLLIVRTILTLCASSAKITGGIFLPILAIGTIFSALTFKLLSFTFGIDQSYYTVILALGITACIAGVMKMPLTAIIFSVEALSFYSNVLYVIIVSVVAYVITIIFKTKSINDSVIDNIIKERNERYPSVVIDAFVTIQKDSFAHGKQIRDILWPANLFVLSFKPSQSRTAKVDEHGEKTLHEGDVLHVRYSTIDDTQTKKELTAIVGEQNYNEDQVTNI
jgi:H+/Cl- antiporter ClcA